MFEKLGEHRRCSHRSWARRAMVITVGCVVAAAFAGSARAAGPSFLPATGSPFTVGQEPHSISTADFNRDGKLDVATANISFGQRLHPARKRRGWVRLCSLCSGRRPAALAGRRRLQSRSQARPRGREQRGRLDLGAPRRRQRRIPRGGRLAGAGGRRSLVLARYGGDFNGDHKSTSPLERGYRSVRMGRGSRSSSATAEGGFSRHRDRRSPRLVPYGIAVADLNRDGKLDLAVAGQFGGTVSIFLGNGAGGFSEAAGSPIRAGETGSPQVTLDCDGKLDLVVANQGARNDTAADDITGLLGDGTGRFAEAATSPVDSGGQGTTALVLADLDGDGRLDIAATNVFALVSLSLSLSSGSPSTASGPAGRRARRVHGSARRRWSGYPAVCARPGDLNRDASLIWPSPTRARTASAPPKHDISARGKPCLHRFVPRSQERQSAWPSSGAAGRPRGRRQRSSSVPIDSADRLRSSA